MECPRCKSTDVNKVPNWGNNNHNSGDESITDLQNYQCNHCGKYFVKVHIPTWTGEKYADTKS